MRDILIVGGGINGCAIARDAAGRGLSVVLVEQGDLASATSSASTKLIHGGLRYLENFEFRLVQEALAERELLLASAPHIIRPMEFILPHAAHLRPKWMIKLGLWLYDNLAKRKRLPASRTVKLTGNLLGAPLQSLYSVGFSYADCWVDDSRLVVFNALDAEKHGATIQTHTKLISATRHKDHWVVTCDNDQEIQARIIVNAAGPWVSDLLTNSLGCGSDKKVKLIKGSHIIVNKLYDGDHAYILQNSDKRIVFVIPYEDAYTLIGTTDVPYSGELDRIEISDKEIDYLLNSVNRFWETPVVTSDIVRSYSGVRPLYDNGEINASVVTRDYVFDLNTDGAPVLSIFGGKITTARKLAEHALEKLKPLLPPHGLPWTSHAHFPGGDVEFEILLAELQKNKPFLSTHDAARLARTYGTRAYEILRNSESMQDLGKDFGNGLTQAEVDYLISKEWATCVDDIIWRRTKMGLHLTSAQQQTLKDYIENSNQFPH